MVNRDLMNNADAEHVARAGVAILDRMQNYPQHIQPLALCAAFITLSEHLRLPAQDLFTVTKNMLTEEENIAEFKALRDYVKYEIKRT
ncbi:hypothetical protein [Rhodopseudomonas palustris]|uniref:Uncharacterized protein n=1 Tax=Rhodopseudomonas palustris TaxID=1076 RepID=A0A323US04_RHOPL|nr:hypothetical protein [Rhodopseudomonas palustris]PZA13976.1 hypothetical protein DNX69_00680 [Rhodopseudomonas palustris]UYO52523.1 hypothetical protein KQX61_18270 [Rhodopseudomonas palustris]